MAIKRYKANVGYSGSVLIVRTGFTLVEILIVVIILGILAAIALPAFSNTSREAKDNMLRENLRVIRVQLSAYQAQHRDVSPGYPGGDSDNLPTEETFIAQMTQSTDAYGDTEAAHRPYGPYLRKIPENPVNGKKRVQILADGQDLPEAAVDNEFGWIYKPSENVWCANCIDEQGMYDYYSY